MSGIVAAELQKILAGHPEMLEVHLAEIEKGLTVAGCETRVHCHCLTVDANGRVRVGRLAEYLRNVLVDYAIPRKKLQEAKLRDDEQKSTVAVSQLVYEAKSLFTDLKNTGEGGEVLLYVLAQHFLKLPQVLCKMDLKTNSKMHYHGADGVYASVSDDGVLKLYWGESKIYKDPTAAIAGCLNSLAPFLTDEDSEDAQRERDLVLLSDKADLSDPALTAAFKKYFDKSSPLSNRVRYCGVALVGFDVDFYPAEGAAKVAADVVAAAKEAVPSWVKQVTSRIPKNKLSSYEIHVLCVPLPSADGFRDSFLKALGL